MSAVKSPPTRIFQEVNKFIYGNFEKSMAYITAPIYPEKSSDEQ